VQDYAFGLAVHLLTLDVCYREEAVTVEVVNQGGEDEEVVTRALEDNKQKENHGKLFWTSDDSWTRRSE
jgi:hypothetical protein